MNTGHLPSPPWMAAWFNATTHSTSSKGLLSPAQLLATLRLACSAISASSLSLVDETARSTFLSSIDALALGAFRKSESEWGPVRLAAVVSLLQSVGHRPSCALLAASRLALSDHLFEPRDSIDLAAEGMALSLDGLMEFSLSNPSTRTARRGSPVNEASKTVPALLKHIESQSPRALLLSLSLPSPLSRHKMENLTDPLAPYYKSVAVLSPTRTWQGSMGPWRLCTLLEAFASWGYCPKGEWLSSLILGACSSPDTNEGPEGLPLTGSHAVSLLRALALIQAADVTGPSIQSLLSLLTPEMMSECSSKQMADIAWSLGAIQYRPDPAWWDSYEHCLLAGEGCQMLGGMTGRSLCDLAWACASVRLTPSTEVFSSLLSVSLRRLPSLDPPSLAGLLWSLCIIEDVGPGQVWMSGWISESAAKMSSFQAHDLVRVSFLAPASFHHPFASLRLSISFLRYYLYVSCRQ